MTLRHTLYLQMAHFICKLFLLLLIRLFRSQQIEKLSGFLWYMARLVAIYLHSDVDLRINH